jgi:F-type H+-transporting ATPase subunit b
MITAAAKSCCDTLRHVTDGELTVTFLLEELNKTIYEAAQRKFEEKLRQAQEEATRTIADAQATARKVADELRAKNDAEIADMKAKMVADIQAAKEGAVKELNDHAVALAATMASKILRREVSAADQSRLVSESLAELSRARN